MKENKTLYVINHCNEWHEYSSFHLIGVVDENHLEKALKQIKRDCGYSKQDMQDYIDVNEILLNDWYA